MKAYLNIAIVLCACLLVATSPIHDVNSNNDEHKWQIILNKFLQKYQDQPDFYSFENSDSDLSRFNDDDNNSPIDFNGMNDAVNKRARPLFIGKRYSKHLFLGKRSIADNNKRADTRHLFIG